MKMLGLMIAMTLVYWVFATYAQSVIVMSEPCSAAAEFAAMGADEAGMQGEMTSSGAGVKLRGRWSAGAEFQAFETAAPAACAG